MKKTYFAFMFLILAGVPALIGAHGGVSNQAGNVVIFLTQQPLSPLINEEVRMTFSVKNKDLSSMPGTEVGLRLIETNNDPALDKTILSETRTSDVNGNFDFNHKFSKEEYYDVELTVSDPVTGEPAVIGFLVQPRQPELPWTRIIIAILIIFGVTSTYTFIKLKKPIQ
jgi:hypothetical protein